MRSTVKATRVPRPPKRPAAVHGSSPKASRRTPGTRTYQSIVPSTSLEGKACVNTETEAVRDAELRYAQRYRTPRVNPKRVVIEVRVERVLGSSDLLDRAED